ncbi:hypothetical protein [Streptomyces rimosus]|uniref:hypothetical protein n=1 Tax=Streptomyces rimosus TaxID=1927 RepID=UPI0004C7780B|nr:hypothetical protein [Streptomyces rimosus]
MGDMSMGDTGVGDLGVGDDMSKNRPERERRAQRAAQEAAPASRERSAKEAPTGESYVSEENGRWVSHVAKPGAGRHRKGPGPVPREDAPE